MAAIKKKTIKHFGRKKHGTKARGKVGGRVRASSSENSKCTPMKNSGNDNVTAIMYRDVASNTELVSVDKRHVPNATARKLATTNDPVHNSLADNKNEEISGFRVVNIENIAKLIGHLACPKCGNTGCKLSERGRNNGMNSELVVYCDNCEMEIKENSGPLILNTRRAEINLRVVASARNCGMGYEKTEVLCRVEYPKTTAPEDPSNYCRSHPYCICNCCSSMHEGGRIKHQENCTPTSWPRKYRDCRVI